MKSMFDPITTGKPRAGKLYYGWIVVGASFVLLTIVFLIQSSFGIFFKPLQETFGWSRATTSWAMTIHLLVYAIGLVPAGWALDRFKTRTVYFVGAFLVSTPLVLTSLISQAWQLYLLFAIMGLGISICGPTALAFITRWFTKNRGIALGIASGGTGLGALLGGPLPNYLITAYGLRNSFVIIGVVSFVFLMICACYIKASPPTSSATGLPPTPGTASSSPASRPSSSMTLRQAMKSPNLPLLIMMQASFLFSTRMVTVHTVPYATDVGVSVSAAALAIGVMGLASATGRVLMGLAQDKLGAQRSMLVTLSIQGASMLFLPFVRVDLLLFVFAIVYGFAWGGDIPQSPALTAQCFGVASISIIYALVMTAGNLFGALGPIAAGYIFDVTGSYAAGFVLAALGLFGGFAAVWRLKMGR